MNMGALRLPGKQRIRQAFDQAAHSYDAAADVQREFSDCLAAQLAQACPHLQPHTILDAGCGTGYSALELQQRWAAAHLTLVDFAPSMLRASLAHTAQAWRVCADIEALPFTDAQFDLYWSSLAWQWNRPEYCLAEAGRVLTPAGVLAVATLGANNFPELQHAFSEIDQYSHVLRIPDPARLRAACQAQGWQIHAWLHQPVRRYYPDLRTLLRRVKAVGAREVEQRRPTPLSRAAWQTITARYHELREERGLPLTYDGLWLIAQRMPP